MPESDPHIGLSLSKTRSEVASTDLRRESRKLQKLDQGLLSPVRDAADGTGTTDPAAPPLVAFLTRRFGCYCLPIACVPATCTGSVRVEADVDEFAAADPWLLGRARQRRLAAKRGPLIHRIARH